MTVLRGHSCSSDVLLHAECLFIASVPVFPLFSPTEVKPLLVLCVNQTLSSPTSSKASRDCRQHRRKGFLSLLPDPDSMGRSQNSSEEKLQIKLCFTLNLSIPTETQSSENLAVCIQAGIAEYRGRCKPWLVTVYDLAKWGYIFTYLAKVKLPTHRAPRTLSSCQIRCCPRAEETSLA